MKKFLRFLFYFVFLCGYVQAETPLISATAQNDILPYAQKKHKEFDLDLGDIREDDKRNWTIVIYMDGDNDLEEYLLKDINELEAGIKENIEVIVLADRHDKYDRSDGDWTDTRVYRIKKDNDISTIHSEILARPGELNLGDPKVLQKFVGEAIRAFPAKHHALVMWDHGGGWLSHANDMKAPGSLSGDDFLTLPELSSAIAGALKSANLDKFDLIGFDMCLMGQLETAVQLQDLAEVMVASEAVEPGDGWPYTAILSEFAKKTNGVRRTASAIVKRYGDFYARGGKEAFTMSAFDLSQTDDVVSKLNKTVKKINDNMDTLWPTIAKCMFYSEAYTDRIEEIRTRGLSIASVDLLDTLDHLLANQKQVDMSAEYEELVTAADRFIMASQSGRAHSRSNGISIYAPMTWDNSSRSYTQTAFAQVSQWPDLLKHMYANQQKQDPPKIKNMRLVDVKEKQPRKAKQAMSLSTYGIEYAIQGKNILWVDAMNGISDSSSGKYLIFDHSVIIDTNLKRADWKNISGTKYPLPYYRDGYSTNIVQYNGLDYVVCNKKECSNVTASMPFEQQYISIPIIYEHPDTGELRGKIYFDDQLLDSRVVVLYVPQSKGLPPVARQITPPKNAKITPLIETYSTKGDMSWTPAGTLSWGEGLSLTLKLTDPGRHLLGMSVMSAGMKPNTAFMTFDVAKNIELEKYLANIELPKVEKMTGVWDFIDFSATQSSGNFVKTGKSITFEKTDNPLIYATRTETTSPQKSHHDDTALLDFRVLPLMSMYSVEKEKNSNRSKYISRYLITFLESKGVADIMFMKSLTNGRVEVAVKRRAASSAKTVAASSVKTDTLMEGRWYLHGDDSTILVIEHGHYGLMENGILSDKGSYVVSNHTITSVSDITGIKNIYSFAVDRNSLTLENNLGERYVYIRGR